MSGGWTKQGMLLVVTGALVMPVSSGFAAEPSAKAAAKANEAASTVATTAAKVSTAASTAATAATPKVATYVGNSASKKFHTADCPYVAKITKGNRVEFATIAAAEQAGYERCKVCWPSTAKKKSVAPSIVKTDVKGSAKTP